MGYETEWRGHGQFEIKGYTQEELMDFSKRRQEILAVAGPNSTCLEREKAWETTRKRKEKIKPEELEARWQEEAKALGLKIVQPKEPQPDLQPAIIDEQLLRDAIEHCSTWEVAFSLTDLGDFILQVGETYDIAQLEQSLLETFGINLNRTYDAADLEELIQKKSELIPLPEPDRLRFTTYAALERERKTIELMQQGQGTVEAIADAEEVLNYLDKTILNEGQRQAVELATSITDKYILWQGGAGTGKTETLKVLKTILEDNGNTVRGFSNGSEAVKELRQKGGIESDTVAGLLHSKPPEQIVPNQYWIVDEGGQIGALDAYRLMQRAEQEKARVLFVGDVKQFSAVAAGNPFKSFQEEGIATAQILESVRQKNPELKLAVDLIARGQVEQGFAQLSKGGKILEGESVWQAEQIVADYMQALKQGQSILVLVGTHKERLELTQAIRDEQKLEGTLGKTAFVTQLDAKDKLSPTEKKYIQHFQEGDIVIPLRNYKRRQLEKGATYEIVGKTKTHLSLKAADGTLREVDTGFDKEIYTPNQIDIAVGDRLKWTKTDRKQGKSNGQEFLVTAIEGNKAQIRYVKEDKKETIDLSKAQQLDYAIVSTTYSAQGKDADIALISADFTVSKEGFYVAVSRVKHDLKLYTENKNSLLKLAQQSKANEVALDLVRNIAKEQRKVDLAEESTAPTLKTSQQERNQSTVVLPIKHAKRKIKQVGSNRPPIQLPVKHSFEKKSDMAAIMKAASRHLPEPPDWLAIGNRVHCLRQGWGEVEAILGHRLIVKLDNGTQAQILEWPDAIKAASVVPEPTESFWIPENPGVAPFHLDPAHWHELTEGSVIHPEIAALNFKSLQYDMVEQAHESWEHLFYSDKLERSNTGRLTTGILDRFAHLDDGGWWCSAGVDPRCFQDLQPGGKPDEKLWGCCKPNSPRVDAEKPDKVIKYEHPLKTDLSVFLLKVPKHIAERIYSRAGVEPSAEDRASGFLYCVWKHNIPITITEGAKKAASLLSQGHAAIGLPGIYAGYRSKDEHGSDTVPRLHSELAVFATPEREIKFCFDYETRFKTKRNIAIAISRTGTLLEQQGAKVSIVSLLGPEKGVDDLVKAQGPLAYELQAITAVPLQAWSKQGRQQFIPATSSPQRPVLKLKRIQSESVHQVSQTSPIVELSSIITASQEQSDERSRQLNAANHDNQGNISTRTDSGESRVNAGDFTRSVTNEHRLEAGVEGLSDAIRGAVELEATERIAGAIARFSASLRDFQPSTRRNSNIRSALERLHQGIRDQYHRADELTTGLTAAITRLGEQIPAESQRQIDTLSTAISNHAETRVLAQQPRLIEALNRLQQRLAVVLEQKQRTRHQLKETLSNVQLPSSTEVIEQLQSAIANLDEQLSQQSVLLKQINSLDNQEFLQLRQQVRGYFEKPPRPPTEVQHQALSQELSQLSTQINQLWQQHSSLAKVVEQMQKNPFRLWNKKYDEALANFERTAKLIKQAIAQKDVCLQQLQEWAKLEQEYQTWSSNPQTAQMQEIASVLKLPQMQEWLTQIRQELKQQAELRRNRSPSQQRQPGRGR